MNQIRNHRQMDMKLRQIAHIENGFADKFGIPRQAGLLEHVVSRLVFEAKFRNEAALRGIEGYDYLWLLWGFSANRRRPWTATVKPPRLGGHRRMGVFATRSPYRPNPIGLSSVRLIGTERGREGVCLLLQGADLMNGTPVYDIKPYLAYADAHPKAAGGFTDHLVWEELSVDFPEDMAKEAGVAHEAYLAMIEILRQDPRPAYDRDKEREFRLAYGGFDLTFRVEHRNLYVLNVNPAAVFAT